MATAAHDTPESLAQSKGQYHVHVATDKESVTGQCKFVRNLAADTDPMLVARPTNDQLMEWFRIQAVLYGADTILVDGRTAEAYICGPAPLNPDGSLQNNSTPPPPPPTPKPR